MTLARFARPLLGLALLVLLLGDAGPATAQRYGEGGGWAVCAREYEICRTRGPAVVRFGVPGRWLVREVGGGGIPCSREAFGGDPAYGVRKVCEVRVHAAPPPPPPGAMRGEFCAPEGGWCRFRGTRRVLYGAHGRFAERMVRGAIPCTNQAFGVDPLPGVPKACYVE